MDALDALARSLEPTQVQWLRERLAQVGGSVARWTVEKGWMGEDEVCRAIAAAFQIEMVRLPAAPPRPEVLASLPPAVAHRHHLLPLGVLGERWVVAVAEPLREEIASMLERSLGRPITQAIAPVGRLVALIRAAYGEEEPEPLPAASAAAALLELPVRPPDGPNPFSGPENRPTQVGLERTGIIPVLVSTDEPFVPELAPLPDLGIPEEAPVSASTDIPFSLQEAEARRGPSSGLSRPAGPRSVTEAAASAGERWLTAAADEDGRVLRAVVRHLLGTGQWTARDLERVLARRDES